MEEFECKRCGYKWFPRVRNVKMCPRCKSHLWREEKAVKEKKKNIKE